MYERRERGGNIKKNGDFIRNPVLSADADYLKNLFDYEVVNHKAGRFIGFVGRADYDLRIGIGSVNRD